MRALTLASLLLIATVASGPAPAAGHDADATYPVAIVLLQGDGSGTATVVDAYHGWDCGAVQTTPGLPGQFTHAVECTPDLPVPPGFAPACLVARTTIYGFLDPAGVPLDHFPDPTNLPPQGLLEGSTECRLGGAVQSQTTAQTPSPGYAASVQQVPSLHLDALRCTATETWVGTPTAWVVQCALNA